MSERPATGRRAGGHGAGDTGALAITDAMTQAARWKSRAGYLSLRDERSAMSLEAVITTGVESAGPGTTAEHLAKTMADSNVGSVVVTEDGVPVGMVTDRDLTEKVIAMGRDPGTVTAADLMSEDIQVLAAGSDVLDATAIMHREAVRRLPVVDDDSRLVGIVTLDDLLRLLATELDNLVGVVERESGFY